MIVIEKSEESITLDGITDFWYRTKGVYLDGAYHEDAWLFGGYLQERFPQGVPIVIGLWEDANNYGTVYYFSPAKRFSQGQRESEWYANGKWELKNNKLTLTIDSDAYEKLDVVEVEVINLSVIDSDNITLKYPNGREVSLARSYDTSIYY